MSFSYKSEKHKQLSYQCYNRGIKELNLLLGQFAERHLDRFNYTQCQELERLLNHDDQDILAWILGTQPLPKNHNHHLLRMLQSVLS